VDGDVPTGPRLVQAQAAAPGLTLSACFPPAGKPSANSREKKAGKRIVVGNVTTAMPNERNETT
jgi:hypothetical protein